MIAPVIIVVCMIAYYMAGAYIVFRFDISNIIKIITFIFSIAITGVFAAVLIERIKEIQHGEEDDLSKY